MIMADRANIIKEVEHILNEARGDYLDFADITVDFGEKILAILKEQENWLGIHQKADGITFISSGTAKQGEKRGIELGKALMKERLEKELLHRGLLTDDIRSAFVKVWGELE